VIVDKAGRRPLLMTSALIMSLSMTVLGIFLYFKTSASTVWGWIPLVSIIVSFIGYSVGFATIPFSIMGEMFPTSTRNISAALSSSFNLTCLFLLLRFYTTLADVIEYHGVYWLFATVNLFGLIFVFFFVPETKGKSLGEIEELCQKKRVSDDGI